MATKKNEKPTIGRKASRPGLPTTSRTKSIAPGDPEDAELQKEFDAKAEQREAEKKEPIQAPLIPEAEIPVREAEPIVNKRMVVTYNNLSLSRDKDGEKLVTLEFSQALTADHSDYVPAKVHAAYSWLLRNDNKLIEVNHVPDQTIDVYADPKEKKPILHLVGAAVTRAKVEVIEESGKGKSKKVVRCKFLFRVERDDKVIDFAAWNDDQQFWITMVQTQAEIE